MGFGINRFRVVGIFVFNAVYHSICKKVIEEITK